MPVLLMTLIITSILATLFYQHQKDIARGTQQLHSDQALLLALSTESLTRELLSRDAQTSNTDHLQETWAQPLPPMAVDGGEVVACLTDAQSRLNLNNFAYYDAERWSADSASDEGSFLHLWGNMRSYFVSQRLIVENPIRLSAARLVDYVDANSSVIDRNGAEDDAYRLKTPSRRAANTHLTQLAEVAQVDGFTSNDISLLQNYVSVLPRSTKVNVNTATPEALLTLHSALDPSSVLLITRSRPFSSLEEFYRTTSSVLNIPNEKLASEIPSNLISLQSSFFQLDATITIGVATLQLNSLVYRASSNDVRVLSRTLQTIPRLESADALYLQPCLIKTEA